jgi:hypothetical protein
VRKRGKNRKKAYTNQNHREKEFGKNINILSYNSYHRRMEKGKKFKEQVDHK